MTALGLPGCMHTSGAVAPAQRPSDLDYMAYGQTYNSSPNSAPGAVVSSSNDGGGAIAALRSSFAGSRPAAYPARSYPSAAYAAAPVYAAAPAPAANDTSYRLDAGDKLRVVVY